MNREPRDPRTPPRVLTIAGSDSGGGAGIQADLKTFAAHSAYGMSAVTAVTVQNTLGVMAVHAVPPELVAAQIDAVLDDIGADAIKIGMLGGAAVARAVAGRLREHLRGEPIPVVLDPVMIAKGGAPLLADEAVSALLEELLPLATVVTPNLPELARLTGLPVASLLASEEERRRAVAALAQCLPGGPAVLAKGGHAAEDEPEVVDLLLAAGVWHRFVHPRLAVRSTHGTGCTLAAALAARLAAGEALPEAASGAIEYVAGAIAAAYPLGRGIGPVDPLYRLKT
ncbi:MAG: hydroxymethylpyrimidine/phosphomethylpyrimidine kinase [Acidobacteriota bacterium]|nr:hydroxymethylpyrimidine/phosphomethylpyrimidine kinase [Acidobacteriota bacterium]